MSDSWAAQLGCVRAGPEREADDLISWRAAVPLWSSLRSGCSLAGGPAGLWPTCGPPRVLGVGGSRWVLP